MTPQDQWKWFGTCGHFICGNWCWFHLCTLVGPWLVSTVGEYNPPHWTDEEQTKNWPGEDIGCDRKYETMVFRAGKPCEEKECLCGLPKLIHPELDFLAANKRSVAAENHMTLCKKWAGIEWYPILDKE